jgi:hypothetical protein
MPWPGSRAPWRGASRHAGAQLARRGRRNELAGALAKFRPTALILLLDEISDRTT